ARADGAPRERGSNGPLQAPRLLAPDGHDARQDVPRRAVELRAGAVEAVEVDPGFWKEKRVLVTGHTGFKGSWLSLWLSEMGADVTGYSVSIPTNPSLFELAHIAREIH